jgi:hypothetical protein
MVIYISSNRFSLYHHFNEIKVYLSYKTCNVKYQEFLSPQKRDFKNVMSLQEILYILSAASNSGYFQTPIPTTNFFIISKRATATEV